MDAMVYINDSYQEAAVNIQRRIGDYAKLFWTGRSQAVRLPKEYRFEGKEVRIRREGEKVILEAEETDLEWAERIAGSMEEDFVQAVLDGHLGPEHLPDGPSFD